MKNQIITIDKANFISIYTSYDKAYTAAFWDNSELRKGGRLELVHAVGQCFGKVYLKFFDKAKMDSYIKGRGKWYIDHCYSFVGDTADALDAIEDYSKENEDGEHNDIIAKLKEAILTRG